ncbi:MAG: hypothetical protein HON94_05310 [Methylococcales bacterium]|nr:hypothetical protein [Methylococcales bacterium]MBT7411169.1 hypothetical protein [Methylococcales bacterium]
MFKSFFKRFQGQKKKQKDGTDSRRWFLKGTAVFGTAAIAAISLARSVNLKRGPADLQQAYEDDVLPGDRILKERGFEEVSKEETDAMVQMFVNDYDKKRQA